MAVVSVTPTGVATPTQPTMGSASHRAETFFEDVGQVIPASIFQVVAILIERGGHHQYRIRGGDPVHERVVREDQIARTSVPQPRG
jgi:hypothetical protein